MPRGSSSKEISLAFPLMLHNPVAFPQLKTKRPLDHCQSSFHQAISCILTLQTSSLDETPSKHQVVYFMITNVEYDVLEDISSEQSDDLYARGRMGELGCWIDPASTRIMQTGLEHSRIPDPGSYFDPGTLLSYPRPPTH